MINMEILGAWVIVFLTLSIFSFLFNDNPLYKAAEHLFAGVSAGYGVVVAYWEFIQPNLLGKLWPLNPFREESAIQNIWYGFYDLLYNITTLFGAIEPILLTKGGIEVIVQEGERIIIYYSYVIPLFLGILMLARLIPSLSWLARYSIAYIVGVFAGLRAFSYLETDILNQVKGMSELIWLGPVSAVNNIILIIGTICALIYFFFSAKHEGIVGKISKTGIWFLMVSFGAAFGFTVMARISLLIGRFDELIIFSGSEYYYSTFFCLILVGVGLGIYFYIKGRNKNITIEE